MSVPYSFQHPPPGELTRNWKQFSLTATTTAKRIEENGFPGRVVQEAWVRVDEGVAVAVSVGPTQDANFHTMAAGETFPIPAKAGGFNLSDWWIKTASSTGGIKVLFV